MIIVDSLDLSGFANRDPNTYVLLLRDQFDCGAKKVVCHFVCEFLNG